MGLGDLASDPSLTDEETEGKCFAQGHTAVLVMPGPSPRAPDSPPRAHPLPFVFPRVRESCALYQRLAEKAQLELLGARLASWIFPDFPEEAGPPVYTTWHVLFR